MSPQEQAIVKAVANREFRFDVPFLPLSDAVVLVQTSSLVLGGPVESFQGAFTAKMAHHWRARGYFELHRDTPGIRNDLYCAIDIAKLAGMLYLSRFGLPLDVCAHFGRLLPALLDEAPGEYPLTSDDHGLVALRMEGNEYEWTRPDFERAHVNLVVGEFLTKHSSTAALFVDWKKIFNVAGSFCLTKWEQKKEQIRSRYPTESKGQK